MLDLRDSLAVKQAKSLAILALLLSSVVSAAQTPTLEEIREAAEQPAVLEARLRLWLDAYPHSAVGWSDDDLRVAVAHLIGAGLAHHPAAPVVAVEQARRHAARRPSQPDQVARAFSVAARVLLLGGRNETAGALVSEGLEACSQHRASRGRFASESEATPCAFLVRDQAILAMRRGEYVGLADQLEEAMDWLEPYPRSDAWLPLLNAAADLACWLGEVSDCFDHYRRSTDYARGAFGDDGEHTAYSYLGQGWAAALANRWGEARVAFERAEQIWSGHLGPQHPRLAAVLTEYGRLLRQSGQSEAAVSVLQRAVGLLESRLGRNAFDLPRTLEALGLTYLDLGELDLAERTLERTAQIRHLHLDQDHVEHAESWSALALVAESRGDLGRAHELLQRSMARLSASLGRDHVVTAESALRLAALLVDRDAERARSLAIDARATLARSYGAEHPAVGRAWWLEARAEAALGADPLPAALAAEELGREHVRRIAVGLSERDLLQYLEVRPRGVDLALETILREAASPARVGRTRQVWQEVARSRALVFDTLSERRQFLAASDQSELSRARQALAHVLVSSVGDREAEYSERLHAARERVEREERALSLGKPSRSTEPPDSGALDLRRVLARLTADEALLAYRIFDARDGPRLAAFFATGTAQTPTVVDLGPWRAIEHELRRWRDAFRSASEEEYRRAAVSLREKLWDPVEPQLRARRCIVVPDGPLFLLPFAALPIDNGYLVERGPTFHYLGAERDLLESVPQSFAAGRVVIVGGPEFGEPDASSSANSALGRFEPLPGALQEASLVAEAWERWIPGSRVERYDGAVATEQIWRRKAPGAVALHLATHGFVLGGAFSSPSVEPAPAPTPVRYRGVGGLAARVEAAEFEPLLAGFALAGANRALTGLAPDATAVATDGTADGIVTLEEIRQLNLHGTQLMVLSFCDSGTGQTLDGEGIFGFTRTFRSAGVRSMVLALAPISDRDSLRFMGHFYSGLLGEGTAVDKALQRASLLLLSELREAQGDTHPRRWGAMVSTGARLHRPSESVRASP